LMFNATDVWYQTRLKGTRCHRPGPRSWTWICRGLPAGRRRTAVHTQQDPVVRARADTSLIGLDLSRHSDRVRADLALRLLEATTSAG
jgi:hypothetical protein